MEGGVAFFLLLILGVIVVGFLIFTYATGGLLTAKRDHGKQDAGDGPRPEHKEPTSPTQEKVEFAGTGREDDE
jgi:hypothetical protein